MGEIKAYVEKETPNVVEPVTSYPPNSQTRQLPSGHPPFTGRPSSTDQPATSFTPNFQAGQPPPLGSPRSRNEPLAPPPVGTPWSTGLYDCHLNQTNAVITLFLPCVTFGQIAEVLDEGKTTCAMGTISFIAKMYAFGSQWILGKNYRKKLRKKFGLVEAPYKDFASHIFCPFCSLCQELRELQNHGLDPALGWKGILARQQEMQNGKQTSGPPLVQEMCR